MIAGPPQNRSRMKARGGNAELAQVQLNESAFYERCHVGALDAFAVYGVRWRWGGGGGVTHCLDDIFFF